MQGLQGVRACSWLSERLKHAACADEGNSERESLVVRASCAVGLWAAIGCCVAMCARTQGLCWNMLSARRSRSWACPPPQVFTGGNADFAGWPACPCRRDMLTSTLERYGDLVRRDRCNGGYEFVVQLVMEGVYAAENRGGGQAIGFPRRAFWGCSLEFLEVGRRPIGGTCGRCLCLPPRKFQIHRRSLFLGCAYLSIWKLI